MPTRSDMESVSGSMPENSSDEILVTEYHKYYEILVTVNVKKYYRK